MKLIEEHRDLFSVPTEYSLVHCISADYALGAGIAKQFAALGVKDELVSMHSDEAKVGTCIETHATKWLAEYNLITKAHYYGKPTYDSLTQSLRVLKSFIVSPESRQEYIRIAMPRIGCGLDRLTWSSVRQILEFEFDNIEGEILVCVK